MSAGGSGYGAAILEAMGAKVVLLESDAGAAEAAKAELRGRPGVAVTVGPLDSGAAGLGPFDLIVVEGAFGVAPDASSRAACRFRASGRRRRVVPAAASGPL